MTAQEREVWTTRCKVLGKGWKAGMVEMPGGLSAVAGAEKRARSISTNEISRLLLCACEWGGDLLVKPSFDKKHITVAVIAGGVKLDSVVGPGLRVDCGDGEWLDAIRRYLDGKTEVSIEDVLAGACGNSRTWTQADRNRVGRCLRSLRWIETNAARDGKRMRVYRPSFFSRAVSE